ncbi:MAG TPA: selenocysteine-specific translation elongation factor [Actinomycetota bacterium]|nr:selenocysteine-specific translation elongation factor [Actinomycetota bacterium]
MTVETAMHVLGTAGHVDHGKSSLVRLLTGIDPDKLPEEKRRGLTIELGFAWMTLPSGTEVGLIDVPGHERFIRNMLAGAGGMTVCLFVVAANEGWKPQSAEHLAIIDILGITSGVVALTKVDLVEPDELTAKESEVKHHLAPSSLAGAPIVPCSSATGAGLEELVETLDRVVAAAPPVRDVDRPRLWVDRVFTIIGAGTVVTGTLAGGRLTGGEEVEIAPRGLRARIRRIQTHKRYVDEVEPGHRVALNLAGLPKWSAQRGDAIARPGEWRATQRVDVTLRVLPRDISGHDHRLTDRGAHILYTGSAETPVTIRLLGMSELTSGTEGFAQLRLRDPLPLERGDRFVLRDAGRVLTFGGGVVLDPAPSRTRMNDPWRLDLLGDLWGATPHAAFNAVVEAEGAIALTDALFRSGLDRAPEGAHILGSSVFSRTRFKHLREDTLRILNAHHADRPLDLGMQREGLRGTLDIDPETFDALIGAIPEIIADTTVVRTRSHQVILDPDASAARTRLLDRIEQSGFSPPLASELDAPRDLVRALVTAGELVPVGGFYLTAAQAGRARAMVRSAIATEGPMTVAQIRDLLDTTRKYAVPLCEWLDTTGATRRKGDVRDIGPHE